VAKLSLGAALVPLTAVLWLVACSYSATFALSNGYQAEGNRDPAPGVRMQLVGRLRLTPRSRRGSPNAYPSPALRFSELRSTASLSPAASVSKRLTPSGRLSSSVGKVQGASWSPATRTSLSEKPCLTESRRFVLCGVRGAWGSGGGLGGTEGSEGSCLHRDGAAREPAAGLPASFAGPGGPGWGQFRLRLAGITAAGGLGQGRAPNKALELTGRRWVGLPRLPSRRPPAGPDRWFRDDSAAPG